MPSVDPSVRGGSRNGRLSVPLLDRGTLSGWKALVELINSSGCADQLLCHQVDQPEQEGGRLRVIPDVHLARVNGLVTDHPYGIHRLLELRGKHALLDQSPDVLIDALAPSTQPNAQLLQAEPQQGGSAPWGPMPDRGSL